MTRIEDLLRQTLEETPVDSTTTDPLAGVERRLHRARRRLAVGAGVAAAAVAAAVVVPLVSLGDGHRNAEVIGPSTTTPSPSTSATQSAGLADVWMQGGAHGVATNDARGHAFA